MYMSPGRFDSEMSPCVWDGHGCSGEFTSVSSNNTISTFVCINAAAVGCLCL